MVGSGGATSRPRLGSATRGPGCGRCQSPTPSAPPVPSGPDLGGFDVREEECTMSTAGAQPRLRVAFAGAFAVRLAQPVRAHLRMPCDIILDDEAGIVSRLSDVDVLVTMAFTRAMGGAATRLTLVQVPGAGLERIDRSALPAGAVLANVYGHETGIAEYVLGAMLTMTRDFARLDAALRRGLWESQWAVGVPPPPVWPELAGKTLGIIGYGRTASAWPGAPGRLTWRSALSAATSHDRQTTPWRFSVVWRSSTRCSSALTIWSSRCPSRRRHAG